MKLFKISQSENGGYDTFDSAVVVAKDETDAASIHPMLVWGGNRQDWHSTTWAYSPAKVDVEYLGDAADGIERGVIVASFNAG